MALHVAYCKWWSASELLDAAGRSELGPYPYPPGEGGFLSPAEASEAAWAALKDYLVRVHRLTMRAIREAALEGELRAWKIPMRKAAVWLCGHDSYHTAQIRSMELAALKGKRAY